MPLFVLIVGFLFCALPAVAAEPFFDTSVLYQGDTQGYKIYRIPGIVVTKKGTVLAYTEARKTGSGDWDTIDIIMRRSTDGAKTFSTQRLMAHVDGKLERNPVAIERKQSKPEDTTYNNPVAIADRDGTVHFLFCLEYMRPFYMKSTDDGITFSKPVEITGAFNAFRPDYAWRIIATGPGHGIQLHNGRLLVPIWLSLGTGGNGHHPSVTSTIYSDDHGKTWHRGEIAVPNTPEFPDPNETTAVELSDGRVMLNVRTEAKENLRTVVLSNNGSTAWSAPKLQTDLPDPVCFAALMRFSSKNTGGKDRILFVHPDNVKRADGRDTRSKDRTNLTVRVSYDNGQTWATKRTVEPGLSGYADLSVLPNGTILCLYEKVVGSGPGARHDEMLGKFNVEWLTEGKDQFQPKKDRVAR